MSGERDRQADRQSIRFCFSQPYKGEYSTQKKTHNFNFVCFLEVSDGMLLEGQTSVPGRWSSTLPLLVSQSAVLGSVRPRGLRPARLLCPWDSPGKNPGVGCHRLLQGIFLIQGLNPGLLHCRQILYHWATGEAPLVILSSYFKIRADSMAKCVA